MSSRNLARRTKAEVSFGGIDITKSIQPYLLSISYTDNEEDETDDLQIKIQDRDDLWLTQWLDEISEKLSWASPSGGSASGDAVVSEANKYLGTPYVWGGSSPSGFDCSGLVYYALNEAGINVPRTTAQGYKDTRTASMIFCRRRLSPQPSRRSARSSTTAAESGERSNTFRSSPTASSTR